MTSESRTFRFGDFSFDSGERLLLRNGAEVVLRPKAFDTLLCLLERNGHLITKSELMDRVWPETSVSESVLDHCISSFSFKGRNLDARKIGRQLNVAAILEGSVRKTGSRLRISTQLIDTAEGYHLWSEQYDRSLEDVFAIQDEISAVVLDTLKVEWLKPKRERRGKATHGQYGSLRFVSQGAIILASSLPGLYSEGYGML